MASTLHGTIRERLLDGGPIQALVGTRIYALRFPEGATWPGVLLQRISNMPIQDHGGLNGMQKTRFQITAEAVDYNTARAIATLIRARLVGWRDSGYGIGGVEAITDVDFEDIDTGHYRVPADYFIWATEPVPA